MTEYLPYLIGFIAGINVSMAYYLWVDRAPWYKMVACLLFGLPAVIAYLLFIVITEALDNFLYWRHIKAIINMKRGKYDNLKEDQESLSKRLKQNVQKRKGFGIGKWLDLIFINGVLKRNGINPNS